MIDDKVAKVFLNNFKNGKFEAKKDFVYSIPPLHTIMNATKNLYNVACRKSMFTISN